MMLILPLLGSCASFNLGVNDGWNIKQLGKNNLIFITPTVLGTTHIIYIFSSYVRINKFG
jgi:hypothetical protein